MSARPIHVRVRTLSGIAVCGTCGGWTSFERPCTEEQLSGIRCAACRSSDVHLWNGSFWATLEISGGNEGGA
jgi:Zn finger protein HypA/HybF involved in hydrogenase expression